MAERRGSRLDNRESPLRDGPQGGPDAASSIPAVLRKQLQGAARPSERRASVAVRHGTQGRKSSRASVRGSVRGLGGTSSGLSGLAPATERVQVLDEEGRDRTPKPLLVGRSQAGSLDSNASGCEWGDGLDSGAPSSPLTSRVAECPALHIQQFSALASLAVFNLSNVAWDAPNSAPASARPDTAPAAEPQLSPSSGGGSGGEEGRRPQPAAPAVAGRRDKAAQCLRPVVATQGCQVLPWDLAAAAGERQQPNGLEPDPSDARPRGGTGVAQGDAAAYPEEQVEDGAEQEAMLAMAEATLSAQESHLMHGRRDSAMRMDSPVDMRSSKTDSRASNYVLDPSHLDSSRRTSRGSAHGGDVTERGTLALSRATFLEEGQGNSVMLSSRGGNTARPSSSVAMPGYTSRQRHSSMTASDAAAETARRHKVEAQRALARLPGIEQRLRSLERLLAQNSYHAAVAQCKHVQLCSGVEGGDVAASGTGQGRAGSSAEGAAVQLDRTASSTPMGMLEGSATASGGSSGSRVDATELWQWKSEATEELPVSCIAWNKVSPDLLAVGYGQLEYNVAAKGMVAFYSLRNPRHPIWQFATLCGVSALDFSRRAGGLLAVGCFDGSVAVYDVRSKAGAPIARAPPAGPDGSGGHAEPVWSLRYVGVAGSEGEGAEGEMLVSVSTDGRMLSWKQTQSLDPVELMALKRSAQAKRWPGGGGGQQGALTEGLLGRHAGGTCFDFSPVDPRVYLVGTEEGLVHKCSTAFTEQYSQTYAGHAAPVYQVRWCPFRPSCFLTCSADWTLRLWSETQPASLWNFQLTNAKSEISDAQWCPANATVFAAAAGNTLQLWDLERSVLKPRSMVTRYGVRLTALSFCAAAPILVCGAADGSVTVYSVALLYREQATPEEEGARLEAALQASMLQPLPS